MKDYYYYYYYTIEIYFYINSILVSKTKTLVHSQNSGTSERNQIFPRNTLISLQFLVLQHWNESRNGWNAWNAPTFLFPHLI